MKRNEKRSKNEAGQVRDYFHRAARRFDSFYEPGRSRWRRVTDALFRRSMRLRFARTLAAVAPGETALDVGCGAGRYALALGQMGAREVRGVDFAANMIDTAVARALELGLADRCRFERADFAAMELAETFDHVFAMGVLDYVDQPEPFVAKMVKAAKRSVMVSFPGRGGFVQWCRKQIFRRIKHCPIHFYSMADVRRIAGVAGGGDIVVEKLAKDYFLTIRCSSKASQP
jgi:ubiquinone/menaquinone biosynthesis C-methylase UbiE